jgi:1-deoxy-D-xylulose-5-phosphate reductoisomerase
MTMNKKRVLLLGCTGSIGQSTLAVVDNLESELELVALAAHRRWEDMLEQVRRYRPVSVALTDPEAAARLQEALRRESASPGAARSAGGDLPRVYSGQDGLVAMVRETAGEIVVGAISGAAGLPANLAALETGKDLALANKESLVMSGALLTDLAQRHGRLVLPVDSEHSAIYQALLSGKPEEVRALILTASGGPFREASAEQMRAATKADALKHPTWKMGDKITIDSATLMNKALEIIEARWLFDMPPEKIRVLVHPQSIVHSLVEFHDGNVLCQMGPPDMKVPIQFALTRPRRHPLPVESLNLAEVGTLTFFPPDFDRFPALRLAYEVLNQGGTAPAAFNAANEIAVHAFLQDEIRFCDILDTVERTVAAHAAMNSDTPKGTPTTPISPPGGTSTLEAVFAADAWAREHARTQLTEGRLHSR